MTKTMRTKLEEMKSSDLRKMASKLNIKNYAKFKKPELIDLIIVAKAVEIETQTPTQDKKNKNGNKSKRVIAQPKELPSDIKIKIDSQTTAQTIRDLLSLGWSRAEVAKTLNTQYQYVRQVHIRMQK